MKTLKSFFLIAIFAMASTLSFANKSAAEIALAKKDLTEDIQRHLNDALKKTENYFYQRGINKVDEEVELVFTLDADNMINVVSVNSDSHHAKEYVKQNLQNATMDAIEELSGKTYRMHVNLYYKAN